VDLEFTADPDPSELTECTTAPPAGEARAKHVSCPAELLDGSLAMGRVGDIVIENSRVRFIVRTGDQSATTIGAPAGGVIDAAPHGGVDLLKEIFPLFGLVSISRARSWSSTLAATSARVLEMRRSAVEACSPARPLVACAVSSILLCADGALRIAMDLTTAPPRTFGADRRGQRCSAKACSHMRPYRRSPAASRGRR
jgi:hypothetical protein